jgi:hypothetical protein
MPGGLGAAGSSDQPLVSALLPPKRSVGPGCGCGAADRRVLSTLAGCNTNRDACSRRPRAQHLSDR